MTRTNQALAVLRTLGFLWLAPLSNPLVAQSLLPDGTVLLSPRLPAPDCTPSSGDDSGRIQQAIQLAQKTVFFRAGCYYLKNPLHLRSGLTYMGEGGFTYNYGSVLIQTVPGNPIFLVENKIVSITVAGLAFAGTNARGIVAVGNSVLERSTIRDNFFHYDLSEGINTPMILTRIEGNGFGNHGAGAGTTRTHIRSVYPGWLPAQEAGDNSIVGNVFTGACCAESVFFESRGPLTIIGNDFESNSSDTTLRVRSTSEVTVSGNWFEANSGRSQIMFIHTGYYRVEMENNWYSMFACPDACVLFDFDQSQGAPGNIVVFMGYEAGQNFAYPRQTGVAKTELTTSRAVNYLTFTGPLFLRNYQGSQAIGHNNGTP